MKQDLDHLTPRETVKELDKFIIGQNKAKKAVAIALRNRTRRLKLAEDLREEIAPKNIIMIGPTGVGKTEIARRLSRLCGAPFVKVEATKYTEVGYVGRDVESMVRDLTGVAVSMVRTEMRQEVKDEAIRRAEENLLDLLLPGKQKKESKTQTAAFDFLEQLMKKGGRKTLPNDIQPKTESADSAEDIKNQTEEPDQKEDDNPNKTREKIRAMLRRGALDDRVVEITKTSSNTPAIEIFSGTGFEDMEFRMGGLPQIFGGKKRKKKVSVKEAREFLLQEEMDKLLDQDKVAEEAKKRTENMGIVFIDEIDKIAVKGSRGGGDVSREGVQRDILPLVEGSQVNTKHGMIDTTHILFIAAGAFHMSKPSDLIPELQGRFPIRVELEDLDKEDFVRILTQPRNALITQYREMLKTEDVTLEFKDTAVKSIAAAAAEVNSKTENIGARRLHTVMELLLEEISFEAPDMAGQKIVITEKMVKEKLKDVMDDQDLSRYIL